MTHVPPPLSRSSAVGGAFVCLAAGASGCATIPAGHAAVDSVRIIGARALDQSDVTGKLATAESPRLLGLLRGVANDYTLYDPLVLQRDLARIERYYRGRGFFEAHARGARVVHPSDDHVRIEILVDEGPASKNGAIRVDGVDALPPTVADAVRAAAAAALPSGRRFDEDDYARAQEATARALTDHGYAYATVHAGARVDLSSHTVAYEFAVSPGIAAVYGAVSFVGLDPDGAGPQPQEIDEGIVRRVARIRPGARYSTAEIQAATQALLDLEVFSAVHAVPGLADPTQHEVPVVFQVEPAKLRSLRLGGGAELDEIKTDVHVLVGWEDHDLLGGLRDVSVAFKPGLVLFPTNVGDLRAPTSYLPEERLHVQFRQPGFLESRTDAFVQPELNVYPLLVSTNPTGNESVVGYVEPKVPIGVERRFGKHLFAKAVYNLQGELPIPYLGVLDPALPRVLLSFPQLVAQLDFKDDPIRPHAGFAADLDLQAAGGPFGGTASDVRIQPDVEGYVPLSRNLTFAVGATLGLLFPFDYGATVRSLPNVPASASLGTVDRDIETVFFRGFFSGGPNSNRGYPLRGIAPHGDVPFLNPATAFAQVANHCDPTAPGYAPGNPACSTPIGGFTQWELSVELRAAVSGPFGAAFFCDAGDVSQHVFPEPGSLRLNYLHASCGAGLRYDTPVGPLRLDIGYRIPPLQILGQSSERAAQAFDPTFGAQPTVFGLPIAVSFGLGEAF